MPSDRALMAPMWEIHQIAMMDKDNRTYNDENGVLIEVPGICLDVCDEICLCFTRQKSTPYRRQRWWTCRRLCTLLIRALGPIWWVAGGRDWGCWARQSCSCRRKWGFRGERIESATSRRRRTNKGPSNGHTNEWERWCESHFHISPFAG